MKTGTYAILFRGQIVGSFRVEGDQIRDPKGIKNLDYQTLKKMNSHMYYQIKKVEEVSTVAVLADNKALMGVRGDNGKITFPGGHVDEGETPLNGATRELLEETGIESTPDELVFLGYEIVESDEGLKAIYCYAKFGKEDITFSLDPDGEFSEAYWVDMSNGVPESVIENLHVPLDRNVMIKLLLEE